MTFSSLQNRARLVCVDHTEDRETEHQRLECAIRCFNEKFLLCATNVGLNLTAADLNQASHTQSSS
jgi:hypothetical protein